MSAPNAFVGRAKAPSSRDLVAALGPAKSLWDEALKMLANEFGLATCDWHSYSVKAG